ncbi:MAG: pyruvate dehydrogenase (acetyl-transferring), homodimeric type, partial [Gammaproteobacteria bacterium]
ERAHFLIEQMLDHVRRSGHSLPFSPNPAYLNTIAPGREPRYPGDRALERRLEAWLRWNAMAMVVLANRKSSEYGGHIASYASSATLYEVGFNLFWRGATESDRGDMIFIQGHSAPGSYSRAFLEGRLTEQQLLAFRQEVNGRHGLSSYPHPWLMPDFWQFPTVSMGLGPMQAIFQAKFTKYLENRGLVEPSDRKVWAFLGDGEMDEPESMGEISLPVREELDNLVFVINCNLQRLDGPVRGNGKIIQELEATFQGAGWKVIKVLWGSRWDPLLARDRKGLLRQRMEECVDGEYQNFKSKDGAYVREHFFGKYDELRAMVADMSDEDIWHLNRGGHDPVKVYAAYREAVETEGRPVVILAKTIKGYGMGEAGEGRMIAHQQKKLDREDLIAFRDRFNIPISDDELDEVPFYKPDPKSEEIQYLLERREKLGGFLPRRISKAESLKIPAIGDLFKSQLEGSGDREISTTMAMVRMLTALARNKAIGKHVVPIVPDEARTFGMEGMFRQFGIYSHVGQLYTPQDADTLMFYKEDQSGQILQLGINEAGALCAWTAAGTAYANHGVNMIPFYLFYSMFGFQRVGDFVWAAGDMQTRGFLIGGTAGRTTLAGEGLQHQDGHSHLLASTVPNCRAYDPAYAYELAVIVHQGLKQMFDDQDRVFYYVTCMNENYAHPAMPEGAETGILKGLYEIRSGEGKDGQPRVQLLGSGTILREVLAAAVMLESEHGVAADVWSATSFNELRRDAMSVERRNRLHASGKPDASYVEQCFEGRSGPFVAATDYMAIVPDQIRRWVPGRYVTLGTDGYGRSDGRQALRSHFEVDRRHVVVAGLSALAEDGVIDSSQVADAIRGYDIDPDKPDPVDL